MRSESVNSMFREKVFFPHELFSRPFFVSFRNYRAFWRCYIIIDNFFIFWQEIYFFQFDYSFGGLGFLFLF